MKVASTAERGGATTGDGAMDQDRPLRVLIAHNAYQQRGGEDTVVEAEAELLRQHGHRVQLYLRHNDEVATRGAWRLARDTLWSASTSQDIASVAAAFQPDIIHVHNTLPLISPAIYWAAHAARIPVVQTLHNFRLMCPQALLLREGRVCEDCVGHVPWRAILHRCYRGSVSQSAAVATMLQTHRMLGTWRQKVTLYVALNAFCKDKFVQGGLPAHRIRIKPNFVDLQQSPSTSNARLGFLFAGRLSKEKGLAVLAQALQLSPLDVRVAGSGPDESLLDGLAGVQKLGALKPNELYAEMASAQALLLPSIWYENFPRTLVEAYANGLPVIASRLGAMATLVQDGTTGLLFEPGNGADLAAKLAWAQTHSYEMAQMGINARRVYEQELTGAASYASLMSIYEEARQTAWASAPE
jgi:glycosyltransferase involved in cell wall biosynthesis